MSNKSFIKGSDNEKRFRLSICALGAILTLCLAVLIFEFLFSLEATKDFLAESAFMVSEWSDTPDSFIDEAN